MATIHSNSFLQNHIIYPHPYKKANRIHSSVTRISVAGGNHFIKKPEQGKNGRFPAGAAAGTDPLTQNRQAAMLKDMSQIKKSCGKGILP